MSSLDGWAHLPKERGDLTLADCANHLRDLGFEVQLVALFKTGSGPAQAAGSELCVRAERLEAARQALREVKIAIVGAPIPVDARSASRCEVHDAELSVPCARCGTFVCPACVAGEAQPKCDACDGLDLKVALDRERQGRRTAGRRALKMVALLFGGLMLICLLVALADSYEHHGHLP